MKRYQDLAVGNRNKSSLLTVLAAAIIVISAHSCSNGKTRDEKILLTVNGEPVTEAEYLHIMAGLRSDIYSFFSVKYGSQMSRTFWSETIDGTTPSGMLKTETIDKLKIIKTEQSLFRKYGITSDISYPCFIKELESENERRKRASEMNLPFYGPAEYDEKTYYEYLNAERRNKLRSVLSLKELAVTDEEILRYHDNTAGFRETDVEETGEQIRSILVEIKYREMMGRLASEAILRLDHKLIDRASADFLRD
ncbi:MAG: hypothetical protein MUE74_05315 [Bacteroidales bacterium]|jgi:hypothetical protein|nr:hypothetical protein [Bacteroidales bacterium]